MFTDVLKTPHTLTCAAMLLSFSALLGACSDNSTGSVPTSAVSTLGVPGAGNVATVAVPAATVTGPVTGKPVLVSTFFSLAALGYEQAEYYVSGTASSYTNVNEFAPDGQWQVQASEQAAYKTRIVVNRPIDPEEFNGSVVVEWLNVSAGFDSAPDWGMLHTELIRQGYAWVGVTAQKVGVESLLDGSAAALAGGDPNRYTDLHHPGDSYAFDIYSQIAQALRAPEAVAPLGDLTALRLIAAGESQSAHYMMTYVNAFAPLHALYDAYFIHSRLAGSASLGGGFLDDSASVPETVRVREDLGTPVMMLQTETDLFVLGSYPSRQEDSANFRLWEVAGTAHADLYTFLDNRLDTGTNPKVAAVIENATPIPGVIDCAKPVNAGPQHFVANAAIRALDTWLVEGSAPTMAARLEVAGTPEAFVLDALGNVQGGIRTPYVDVPIATLSGEGQPRDQAGFCFLSGTTALFDAATLGSLYTDNADYIDAVTKSADDAVSKGFLIPEDAALIKAYAQGSDIFAP
ncbi:MAG: hypothetical protein KDI17_16070 [Halioglobus sp.]|nr:hypothetical protein [Halioglobus sp.]